MLMRPSSLSLSKLSSFIFSMSFFLSLGTVACMRCACLCAKLSKSRLPRSVLREEKWWGMQICPTGRKSAGSPTESAARLHVPQDKRNFVGEVKPLKA